MKFRTRKSDTPVRVLIGEDEHGNPVADQFVSLKDPKLAELSLGRAYLDMVRLEQIPGLSVLPVLARVMAKMQVNAVKDIQTLAEAIAPSCVGLGGMFDEDGESIPYPRNIDDRVEFFRLNFQLMKIAYEGSGAAGKAHRSRSERDGRDLGNSSSSSAGTAEEAPADSHAGSSATQTAN